MIPDKQPLNPFQRAKIRERARRYVPGGDIASLMNGLEPHVAEELKRILVARRNHFRKKNKK